MNFSILTVKHNLATEDVAVAFYGSEVTDLLRDRYDSFSFEIIRGQMISCEQYKKIAINNSLPHLCPSSGWNCL